MSVRVSSLVWDHAPVEGSDLLVLLVIADAADHDGTNAWPSHATIARMARLSERSTKRIVGRLRERGLIDVAVQRGGTADCRSDRRPNRYRVAVEKLASGVTAPSPRGRNGVTREVERGDTGGTYGVTPVSPNPSLNRPEPTRARSDNVVELWTDEKGRSWAK